MTDADKMVDDGEVGTESGGGDPAPLAAAENLDAIVAGALVVLDQVDSLEPCLPDLAPGHRERVDPDDGRGVPHVARRTGFAPREPRTTKRGVVLPMKKPVPLGKATIGRRLAASQPDASRLEKAMRAICKDERDDLPGKKRAADGDVLRDMIRSIVGEGLRAYRDRALLAIGMAGAFRCSELVAITVARVSEDRRGLLVRISSSKTDQEGKGQIVAIPDGRRLEPVRHYRAWLEQSGVESGAVFRKLTPQGRLTDKPMSARGDAGCEGCRGRRRVSARDVFGPLAARRVPDRGRPTECQFVQDEGA